MVWDDEDDVGTPVMPSIRTRRGWEIDHELMMSEFTTDRDVMLLSTNLERAVALGRVKEVIPKAFFYPETGFKHEWIVAVEIPNRGIRYVLWTRVIPL